MYHPSHINLHSASFDPLASMTLEFIEFNPPNGWSREGPRKAFVISAPREPAIETGIYVVQDPGHGIVNVHESNNFDPAFKPNRHGLGSILRGFIIPTSQNSSCDTIVKLLREVPIVDLRTNPEGMFPWNFGNYVKRVLERLAHDGHVNLASMQCTSADEMFDRHFSDYFNREALR